MSDGAAALLLMAREKAEALGLKPRARVLATAVVGDDPTVQLTGVIPATGKALKRAGLEVIAIN
jgi:acetyl-CoA C-acetyltransferase/acetyl-CoA acyltransferase